MDDRDKTVLECTKRTLDAIEAGTFENDPPTFDDLIQKEKAIKLEEEEAKAKAKLEYDKELIDSVMSKWGNDIEEF